MIFEINTFSILPSSFPGYGFVDFQNPQDAQKALDTLQSQGVMVQFARVSQLT